MALAYLSVGSNLGDRRAACRQALSALDALPGGRLVVRSGLYETEPVDVPGPLPAFLNLAAGVETSLEPLALLEALQAIEIRLGRVRPAPPGAARIIDLDLLLLGDRVFADERLVLPHPRMHQRRFVLEPLAEIAPGVRHPRLGRTVAQLLAELGGSGGRVRRLPEEP